MRLDGLLTALNIASRAQARRLIAQGRVTVSGRVVLDPSVHVDGAEVFVDGKKLDTRLERALMMNKPAGVLTAADDKKQKTVMDLLDPLYASLGCMPVGRLDKDTTGLLLFTTDGVLAHRLIAPRHEVLKVYVAQVDGPLSQAACDAFARGIRFKDFDALPARLEILEPSVARVTVGEGKFHQVKRMLHAVGYETLSLRRVSFGPLSLDKALAPGEARELKKEELAALYGAAGMEA